MQTFAEKCAAIESLLPCITLHLDKHPSFRVVPKPRWVSEGEPPPHHESPPPCDERCVGCGARCLEEAWLREYYRLRGQYPIIRRLERLADLEITYHDPDMRTAIRYSYLEPWRIIEKAPYWKDKADCAVEWLAGNCRRDVPLYVPPGMPKGARTPHQAFVMVSMRGRGLSYRKIAQRLEVPKSTVHDFLRKVGFS
jgi:hypothetical protein